MVYTTASSVRGVCGLTTSEVSDASLTTLISKATKRLNGDLQVRVIREQIIPIDRTRENKIDGSNTTYYVKNWEKYYIGDADDDGDVDTGDITVYQVDADGTETELTVSSITPNSGYFVLSSAPAAGVRLFVTYVYSPVSMSDPHGLVVDATDYLAASMAFLKIDPRKVPQFAIGNLRISKQSEGYKIFFDEYKKTLDDMKKWPLVHLKVESLTRTIRPGFDV